MLPRLSSPTRPLPTDGIMATDAELDALWQGTPDGGELRPEAAAWIAARTQALRAEQTPARRGR